MKKVDVSGLKSKSFFFAISLVFITMISMYACKKNQTNNFLDTSSKKTYTTDNHKINYSSSVGDSILNFNIQIYKISNNVKEIDESFEIDLRKAIFEKDIYEILSNRSQNPEYNNLPVSEVRTICKSLRSMIYENAKSLTPKEMSDPRIEGLSIGLSFVRRILSSKLGLSQNLKQKGFRSRERVSNVDDEPDIPTYPPFNQDVYEGYNLGMSSFVLNEDIIVNKAQLEAVISQDLISMTIDDKGLYVFQEVLENMNGSIFTLRDLLAELDDYRNEHPTSSFSWWPRGSSHGCCGNYNGPCYYWNALCYIHDVICRKCQPASFCLSGCVPDVSTNIDIEPFTFIEDQGSGAGTNISLLLPTPLPFYAYYLTSLTQYNPENEPLDTPIFYNTSDGKYYSDAQFQNVLIDAYYFIDNYALGKYYLIVGGKVDKVGFAVY
ncbi:hypothetical protein [Pedobacter hiemivivus]|uniref:Uncharacterized protein n=1 Tax=Pedobacter hiemivivus TaxID=2530454 RepID=A0A4V2MKI3_9SPHI|nr:hypothetical protein [Pedobacter hiemivivus]TCC98326.1 hypothetical protein EZ444_03295 [Pedobacter hiemivivus]